MSNEDQAGAKRGLVQQEVVMRVENKIGKESGLMDTQQQVDFLPVGRWMSCSATPLKRGATRARLTGGRSAVMSGMPKAMTFTISLEVARSGTL